MTAKEIFDWYVNHGLSESGAAGMTANICIESAYNSKNLQNSYEKKLGFTDDSYTKAVDSGKYSASKFQSDKAGYGYCQWTSSGRKTNLLTYAKEKKVSIGDPIMQLEFSLKEMSKTLKEYLQKTTDPYDAAVTVMLKFERPANQTAENQKVRGNKGKEVFNSCASKKEVTETKKEDDGKLEIIKHYLTKNRCYIKGAKMTPKGIVVHSTGCNNKNVTRYVDMPSLGTVSSNHWNSSSTNLRKCVHAIIGWSEKKKKVVVVNTLPYSYKPWGCASGKNGSYNNSHIQFEICEDAGKFSDKAYFNEAYKAAVDYCAYLCKQYKLSVNTIVSHKEAHAKGYASNHGDADSYFKVFGKSMKQFRKDVETAMGTTVKQPSSTTKTETSSFKPYMITVTADKLNVRKEPVYDPTDKNVIYVITKSKPGPYTIVEEKNGWGKLKSGIGWINLKYTKKYVAKK